MAEQAAAPQHDRTHDPTMDNDGTARKGIDNAAPIIYSEVYVELKCKNILI